MLAITANPPDLVYPKFAPSEPQRPPVDALDNAQYNIAIPKYLSQRVPCFLQYLGGTYEPVPGCLQKDFGKCDAGFIIAGNYCQATCGRCAENGTTVTIFYPPAPTATSFTLASPNDTLPNPPPANSPEVLS